MSVPQEYKKKHEMIARQIRNQLKRESEIVLQSLVFKTINACTILNLRKQLEKYNRERGGERVEGED